MEFVLPIDNEKFRSTNGPWNDLMLNDPWSIGYVTTIIELEPFLYKEEWEAFYLNSGAKRNEQLLRLSNSNQQILQDELLVLNDIAKVNALGYDLKNLNTQYGRTKEQLFKKGEILFERVKDNGLRLTVEECYECIRFRTICETWNGVIVRERNTIATLKSNFPNWEFRKVPGEIDHTYAVDYEIYKDGKLSSAIQIKPKSYTGNAPYILKARNANRLKNQKYFELCGVKVFDVISKSNGFIINQEVLKNL